MSAAHYGDYYGDGEYEAYHADYDAARCEAYIEECRERCYRGDHAPVTTESRTCACGRRPLRPWLRRRVRNTIRRLTTRRVRVTPDHSLDGIPF